MAGAKFYQKGGKYYTINRRGVEREIKKDRYEMQIKLQAKAKKRTQGVRDAAQSNKAASNKRMSAARSMARKKRDPTMAEVMKMK